MAASTLRPSRLRFARLGVLGVVLAVALACPGGAIAGTLAAAAPSPYNSTPDCPVSATAPVCAWNVPVDNANLFGALDYGECPYWAVEKYPALVLDAVAGDPLIHDWDGGTWLEHALAEGLPTSRSPAPGDLAVWQPVPGNATGHVAYVEAVLPSGIIVSQMDGASQAPFPSMQGSTEFISNPNLTDFAASYGLAYVVTGDAPSTPLSYVESPSLVPMPSTAPAPAPVTTPSSTPVSSGSATAPTRLSTQRLATARAKARAQARARARARAKARARAHARAAARARARRR